MKESALSIFPQTFGPKLRKIYRELSNRNRRRTRLGGVAFLLRTIPGFIGRLVTGIVDVAATSIHTPATRHASPGVAFNASTLPGFTVASMYIFGRRHITTFPRLFEETAIGSARMRIVDAPDRKYLATLRIPGRASISDARVYKNVREDASQRVSSFSPTS